MRTTQLCEPCDIFEMQFSDILNGRWRWRRLRKNCDSISEQQYGRGRLSFVNHATSLRCSFPTYSTVDAMTNSEEVKGRLLQKFSDKGQEAEDLALQTCIHRRGAVYRHAQRSSHYCQQGKPTSTEGKLSSRGPNQR